MVTSYNLDFDIAAIFILLLEMIYVRVQYSHDRYSSRLFIMLLHSSFLLGIVDIISSLMLSGDIQGVSRGVLKFTCSFYYLLSAFTIMVFYRYVVELLDIKLERTVSYYVVTYFPFVFTFECLVANYFGNVLFSGGNYGYFSYGPLISVIYYYPVYYFFLTILRLVSNRQRLTLKQWLPVLAYMVSTTVTVITQYLFQNVMVMTFGFALALLIMMLSLETPDYKRLVRTTELLEAVRGEFDYQSEINAALITEMSMEIDEPMERLLDKNRSYDPNEYDGAYSELHEYVNGYGEIVRSVIDNAIEFKLLGNRQDIKTCEYNIRELAYNVRNIMLPAIKDASNEITINIDSSIPEVLVGAPELLKQIMINLMRESIERTQEGMIDIEVSGRNMESDSMNLIISVSDNGTGIDRDTVRRLVQFNTKSTRWNKEIFNGGYFKLRIAKHMIEGMHGKLHIDSDIEKGSKYTVVIPQGIAK